MNFERKKETQCCIELFRSLGWKILRAVQSCKEKRNFRHSLALVVVQIQQKHWF